ncbi:hypothetical protein GCK72_016456 [Caenorhabditis remanei]|uniref:CRE-MAB-23 protein n=1 Tax=Caenorhabditis remanei TaxID=31234 RepID=E3MQW6_CAERE|nr:hypothetical protein GCK72_016456 [Caenorhabditis remanei]EFP07044.1 CRE-MAB-23 protein [Caenorhabditis remanei]KAF1749911.1 hypothetical protein GCK72_016456 [Caenorhabditis remanei]
MAPIHHRTSSSSTFLPSLKPPNVDWSTHCPMTTPLLGPSTPALLTFPASFVKMPKEQYMCQLCANHGIFNQPKKGHKQKCPYRTCPCSLCALNTKRRALDQIERQLKHTNEPMVAHTPTSMTSPQPECQLSPTIPKQAPNNPTCGKDTFRNSISTSNNMAFTVQLPATITKRELKLLRRDETPLQNPLKRSFPKTLDDALESMKKEKMSSIFHSAEMLAIGESTNSLI